jgi:hypothetical protein
MAKSATSPVTPPLPLDPQMLLDLEAARKHAEVMAKAAETARGRVLEIETEIRQKLTAGAPPPRGWVARIKEIIARGRRVPKWKEVALEMAEKAGLDKATFETWVQEHTEPSPDKSTFELEVHRETAP